MVAMEIFMGIMPIIGNTIIGNAATTITITPPKSSELIDVSQTAAPDALDPATGFYVQDGPLFTAVYQELVEFNGSHFTQVVPVIAQNYSTSNYENYTFYIRPYVHFSDGVQVNASTVWFSLYRTILMGQGPGVSNYLGLLFSSSVYASTGYAIPWGVNNAIQYATGLKTADNYTLTAMVLANVLSHFNANNATIQKIMSYPGQAIVVKGPYEVQINVMEPYRFFLEDIAAWWGAIVDPVFVDQHGGVQPNTPNSYANDHGMPGTGPYEIYSVSPGLTTIVLKATPNYWATGKNVPSVAQPAHIQIIEIEYGLSHEDRVEMFDKNEAQISYVSVPFFNEMYSGYAYKIPFSDIFANLGSQPSTFYVSMNNEIFPTNITAFRLGLEYAINYTELADVFSFNHTVLALYNYLGPITPQFKEYYNPGNLKPFYYDPSLAIHYLNEAAWEGHFSLVLPNGVVLGNSSSPQLKTLDIYAIAPVTSLEQEELDIITQNLGAVGISASPEYVTPSVTDTWTTPSGTPALIFLGWFPDWPDPIYQQLIAQTDVSDGGISGNFAWVNISTLNTMYQTLPFLTSQTQQINEVKEAYQLLYNDAPYIWLPSPYTYYFVQPYLKGFTYDQFTGYFYNMMYYQNFSYTPPSYTTTTPSSFPTLAVVGIVVVVIVIIAVLALVLMRGRGTPKGL
ncbi:peptide ABC transporter permease [Candidatus Acidianus copahuensis]|uniref:Peptide ABC transporter permease n=2 Tax=Candidatus Acidianus copahuensis TaxID=1160895 RepID=A0A031LLF7_9CREN|nr:peptide ABC transporter permease [Candidatus Acidianus copahuensis]